MRILMLVATTVATDTRVLREATTLVGAGHAVHVIGRSVPEDWEPPHGITASSVGTSSVFRAEGTPSLTGLELPPHMRFARWMLLPQHRNSAFGRWADGAIADGRAREFDVVHAHDFTALRAGATLAEERGVPLVYDTHELWSGRPREYRPTPLLDRHERTVEGELGSRAAAVITVGDGVARALRNRYGWNHVTVVRNTFPHATPGEPLHGPRGLVYAGRLAAYRELETVADASARLAGLGLPVALRGPADPTWLASFDKKATRIEPPCPPEEVTAHLAAAGLVLVTHSDTWENHRLALPNKLFHAVQAGVPVVATDVGELAATVRQYGLGTLYTPGDPDALVEAAREAVADYAALTQAVRDAEGELNWDTDSARLLALYHRLATDGTATSGAVG
ncbi:glycosyltransferase [Mobilicoccus pelagius]|uniref:D-inositol 3-phosphate glycosyltransferase n=1 Tax=Mobilicoccus pelagius NBRC 104925 TaxID=1089455 RepID=H5UMX8_9MICO|nr:glycosyltransferase [Mobilicoccus pelagius]GAB47086.1 putative glycosyltransferase [Mobilicoccus pelagius NBRC 104925]